MFEQLDLKPGDPILRLMEAARVDPSPNTADLTAGVFKSDQGVTPIPAAIKMAERRRPDIEDTKVYLGIQGDERFNQLTAELVFGKDHSVMRDGRLSCLQTIGGSAALFLAARVLVAADSRPQIYVGTPTWGNHFPLLTSAGASLMSIPYYDLANNCIDFDGMISAMSELSAGSVVLLHGCCHNPTGADMSHAQWDQVADILVERNLLPFVDAAYHGMAQDLDTDAYSWRMLAERVPEMILSYSCSKNFGLYRDRIGMLAILSRNKQDADKTRSNLMSASRQTYSMPAAHGAFMVAEVLEDTELRADWMAELEAMRSRVNGVRQQFAEHMRQKAPDQGFDFVAQQYGMFSLLGITPEQVVKLREDHSVYILESSRINFAGLTADNLDYVTTSLAAVLS